jgi:hypothetical protein
MLMSRIAWLLILAGVVRLCASLSARDIIDIHNYQHVAEIIHQRGMFGLYTHTPGIYPYPPVWVGFEMTALWLHWQGVLPFSLAIRLPIIIADVAMVAIIWRYVRRHTQFPQRALLAAALYALNPVSIIISCWHGQFDALPVCGVALAMLFTEHHWRRAAGALGIGIALKSFPVLLLPMFARQQPSLSRQIHFILYAILPVLFLLIPFLLADAAAVIRELFCYRGHALLGVMVPVRTIYVPLTGERFPVDMTLQVISLSAYGFLGLYGWAVWYMSRFHITLPMQATIVFLLFYVVYAGISPQYVLWVLPFMIMATANQHWPVLLYSAVSTPALIGLYLYAVADIFPFTVDLLPEYTRLAYGVFGSLWWGCCLLLLVVLTRQAVTSLPPGAPVVRQFAQLSE